MPTAPPPAPGPHIHQPQITKKEKKRYIKAHVSQGWVSVSRVFPRRPSPPVDQPCLPLLSSLSPSLLPTSLSSLAFPPPHRLLCPCAPAVSLLVARKVKSGAWSQDPRPKSRLVGCANGLDSPGQRLPPLSRPFFFLRAFCFPASQAGPSRFCGK